MRHRQIAKNTFVLYVRQIFLIAINLYTVRVVLQTLGIEDYGVYTVVTGVVTLCAFLPNTMASATQRYFSYALGRKDSASLQKNFSVNLVLYLMIALSTLLILESLGLWFLDDRLAIPAGRLEAAKALYHFATVGFVFSAFTSPFMAIMIAHEDMHVYSLLTALEALMKLLIVFLLMFMAWDKLALYGALLLAVSVVTALGYMLVCLKRYPECQLREFHWDGRLFREIVGFTGWTLFGQLTSVGRNQAVTILLNQMFNPATVAARALATAISSQVMVFASNFNTGLYPSIIKTYAAREMPQMFSLIFHGSKLTFFLLWVFSLPLFLEMDTVLAVWLANPPAETALFTRLALVEMLIFSVSLPLTTAARAPGKMMAYELTLGSMQVGVFAGSWIALRLGYPAYSVFVVAILVNILLFASRLALTSRLIDLSIRAFVRRVIMPVTFVALLSAFFSLALKQSLFRAPPVAHTPLVIAGSIAASTVCMYFLGMTLPERLAARRMLAKAASKLRGSQ